MPLLTLYAPPFSYEQKKIMAAELTDALQRVLNIATAERDSIVIRFAYYQPEELSIGGRLVQETEEPLYWLEIEQSGITSLTRNRLAHCLHPLLLELLGLPETDKNRVHIAFRESQAIKLTPSRKLETVQR